MLQREWKVRPSALELVKRVKSLHVVMEEWRQKRKCDCLNSAEFGGLPERVDELKIPQEAFMKALDLNFPISWDIATKDWIQKGPDRCV
jgi:hypothetical protein